MPDAEDAGVPAVESGEPGGGEGATSADEADGTGARNAAPEPVEAESEAPPPQDSAPRSPRRILTAPKIAFMLNYLGSGVRRAAEKNCDARIESDPEQRAECLQKARDDFKADVLVFDPAPGERRMLRIYKREGSALIETFSALVELSDASEYTVSMKFVGAQRGQRPISGGGTVALNVPNDSTVEIDDPRYGTLPYTAKIGMVGQR